jgi:hypothetical protein
MDRHVAPRQARGLELVETASLLAMTNQRGFFAFTTQRLGVGPSSRNDTSYGDFFAPFTGDGFISIFTGKSPSS